MYTIPTSAVYQGMAVLFLCGFFVYGPQSSFWALCPDLVGRKRAGTATGVMNFCAYLFAGLGEPIIGHYMDGHSSSVVFLIVSMCTAASAVVALFIRR
jgi:OPA family glycerol-3-phosphate transporter-like MFS transporter